MAHDQVSAARIALVHALRGSIEPCADAFSRGWPEALTFNLLDDSLSRDLEAAGGIDDAMRARLLRLGRYCLECGADALLFTCSAFGEAIEGVADDLPIPVVKPNEAMLEEAVRIGGRLALLATFAPTLVSMAPEVRAEAERQGRGASVAAVHVEGALAALTSGDAGLHDRLVAEAAAETAAHDVVCLTQFSMARAEAAVRSAVRGHVLTTPDTAVSKLRRLLGA